MKLRVLLAFVTAGGLLLLATQTRAQASDSLYVSPGISEAAVDRISHLCRGAYRFLSRGLSLEPRFKLYILSEKEWPLFSDQVFGMPSFDEKNGRLIVAGEPSRFWEGLTELLEKNADPRAVEKLRVVYTNKKGQVDLSPFFELLVLHELGHAFHLAAGVTAFPRPWLQEFYANLALHMSLEVVAPQALRLLLAFPAAMQGLPRGFFPHEKLAEFDFPGSRGVSPENYVWYQARLHLAAKKVYDESGTRCLSFLTKNKLPAELKTDELLAEKLKGTSCDALAQVIRVWR